MRELIEALGVLIEGGTPPKIVQWVEKWEVDDYPSGRSRVPARWTIERKGSKARISRETGSTKIPGKFMSPKRSTYSDGAIIGVGADGRAYPVRVDGDRAFMNDGAGRGVADFKATEKSGPGDDFANQAGMLKIIAKREGLPDTIIYVRRKDGKPAAGGIETKEVKMVKRAVLAEPEKPKGPPPGASTMSSKAFVDEVIRLAKPGVGVVTGDAYNQYNKRHDTASITLVNAPAGKRSGTNYHNNRVAFTIKGFGREEGEGSPTGKVKAEISINSYRSFRGGPGIKDMRAKTGPPEKIAKYVADYISLAAKEEPHLN